MEYKIDETRRNGVERRQGNRKSGDRRGLMRDPGRYIPIIKKIPIFKGLKLDQFKNILSLCKKRVYSDGAKVIISGSASTEMYVLIKGTLKIVLDDETVLTNISPVAIVGEMGVFTGEERSASVVADGDALVFAIHGKELLRLFKRDSDLGIQVLTNVISDLSGKLKKSNALIDDLKAFSEYDYIHKE